MKSRMVAAASDSLQGSRLFHVLLPQSHKVTATALRPCVLTPGNAFKKGNKKSKKKM